MQLFFLPVGILEVSDSKGRTTAGVVDDVFDDSLKRYDLRLSKNTVTGKKNIQERIPNR